MASWYLCFITSREYPPPYPGGQLHIGNKEVLQAEHVPRGHRGEPAGLGGLRQAITLHMAECENSTRSSARHQRGRAKFATHRRFLEVPEEARLTNWISVQKELHANVLAREPNASNRNSDSQASRPRLYVLPPVKGWAGDIDGNKEGKDIRH